MSRQIKFIQGNEACVEGALYAGLDFFAGYPITPSTEIAEHLSKRLPSDWRQVHSDGRRDRFHVRHHRGESLTGHKVLTATSGPGFFAEAGSPGLRGDGRDPLRDRQRAARRPRPRGCPPT
jgi:2-oxoglutarate ferredoxin oxidoreductase subunit alpha